MRVRVAQSQKENWCLYRRTRKLIKYTKSQRKALGERLKEMKTATKRPFYAIASALLSIMLILSVAGCGKSSSNGQGNIESPTQNRSQQTIIPPSITPVQSDTPKESDDHPTESVLYPTTIKYYWETDPLDAEGLYHYFYALASRERDFLWSELKDELEAGGFSVIEFEDSFMVFDVRNEGIFLAAMLTAEQGVTGGGAGSTFYDNDDIYYLSEIGYFVNYEDQGAYVAFGTRRDEYRLQLGGYKSKNVSSFDEVIDYIHVLLSEMEKEMLERAA